jgi:hypothetical protein
VACSLVILALFIAINRKLHVVKDNQGTLAAVILNRLSEASDRQRGMKRALLDDGKLIRERIAQVKTRLANEKRDDRRDKANARREGVQS